METSAATVPLAVAAAGEVPETTYCCPPKLTKLERKSRLLKK